jgi:glucose/arabinose dehydrogenase
LPRLFAVTTLALAAALCWAQQQPPAEEPFWAKGRPKTDTAMKMAPIAAFPIPTAADKLPVAKMKLPPGFKAEVWASNILDARSLRQGDQGTVFVSSLFVAGKVYAVVDKGGAREVKTIAEKLMLPSGIEYHKGSLYVATPKDITRYDNIEASLDKPPTPVTVYDKLPGDVPHGWKFIKVGPDGKLYVPVGAPCNICEPSDNHAKIMRMNLDGSNVETVARGVRNTVGFDFDPKTGHLWFTDNQRDWLSEDLPNDELNHLTQPGNQHFGYPYCHQGSFADPEFGWGKSCDDYAKPVALLGPHTAPLGMRFYTGKMFPAEYRDTIFVARRGSWNRAKLFAFDVVNVKVGGDGKNAKITPFMTGFMDAKQNTFWGRPVDVLQMPDGSLLVADEQNGAIYRVTYTGGTKKKS